ncbi:SHOCT domain-containing protein [Halorubellus salinus]|uniref:SHOCT domain-containing protein n=1 Tax=Halorubellus salinus TaxID=755309 RepID=UPI001D085DC6|nr:SHOCT domain-containing protein [Halorubellus salinus]
MNRNTAIALGVAALALVVMFATPILAIMLGLGGMGGGGWWMPMDGPTWGSGMHDNTRGGLPGWFALVGLLSQLAFVALLAAGAYLLYRVIASDDGDRALEELRAAYARGDIDDGEYERRKDRLQED